MLDDSVRKRKRVHFSDELHSDNSCRRLIEYEEMDCDPIEDDEDFAIHAAAVRITGWDGITQPYSYENAVKLVTVNSEIRDQVFKASNELANFTKT